MGMYKCNICYAYCDSDDGCTEDPENDKELICPECEYDIDNT